MGYRPISGLGVIVFRIGLIADTHVPGSRPEPWDEIAVAFEGVDLIMHGGDIEISRCLDWLERIAPVVAAEGNHDTGLSLSDPRVKKTHVLDIEGSRVGLIHIFEPLEWGMGSLMQHTFGRQDLDVVVCGDTHIEVVEWREGILVVNPGSAMYPRNMSTRLGHIGFLEFGVDGPSARIVSLSEYASPGQ